MSFKHLSSVSCILILSFWDFLSLLCDFPLPIVASRTGRVKTPVAKCSHSRQEMWIITLFIADFSHCQIMGPLAHISLTLETTISCSHSGCKISYIGSSIPIASSVYRFWQFSEICAHSYLQTINLLFCQNPTTNYGFQIHCSLHWYVSVFVQDYPIPTVAVLHQPQVARIYTWCRTDTSILKFLRNHWSNLTNNDALKRKNVCILCL